MSEPAERAVERWCVELADVVSDVSSRVGRLAELIVADWPDRGGRDLAERAVLVGRELGREAVAAAALGRAWARVAEDGVAANSDTDGAGAGMSGLPRPAVGGSGMRLADPRGSRADDERGMRIAELTGEWPPADGG